MCRGLLTSLCGLACASLAAAQSLINPNFDTSGGSLTGWTTFNNVVPNVYSATATPRSAPAVAKIFGSYSGGQNYSGIYQNLTATAGQTWTTTAYFRHNTGDSLIGTTNFVTLKIEFYKVSNGVYGSADFLGEYGVTALDASTATDTWVQKSVSALAPATTVEARLSIVFTQNNNNAGAVLVDDATFSASAGPPPITWTLVWSDDFSNPTLDGTKWDVENDHPIKNNELEYYAPDEVYVQSDNLVLRSRQRTYSGYDTNGNWGTWNYTSGLVRSINRFATAYGKIEIRAKAPSTKGIWPAHWMLPDSGAWPPEIDIMELKGSQPSTIYMTHHFGAWPNVQNHGGTYTGPNYALDYHTYAVEWSPTRIDWKIDGVVRFSSTDNIPKEPFYIILNTAVGGDFDGNPNGSTVFPQYHMIDYVRVYMPADPGTPTAAFVDTNAQFGQADGNIQVGEYPFLTNGINSGSFDMLGHNSTLNLNTSGDGRLLIGINSVTAWPSAGPYGAVVYFDTKSGGWPSTYLFKDTASRARRMVSGKSASGPKSDVYFAMGVQPEYALALEPNNATLYKLDPVSHVVLDSALVNASADQFGGTAMHYALDDGSSGLRIRECEVQLSQLGLRPGSSFLYCATLLNGDSAFRMNEFVGVATGNTFDTVNPGQSPATLKPGDFIRFTAATAPCGSGCNLSGDSADINSDCHVDLIDVSTVLSGYGLPAARHDQGDANFDGVVDLVDLSEVLAAYGATCP